MFYAILNMSHKWHQLQNTNIESYVHAHCNNSGMLFTLFSLGIQTV